MKFYFISHIMTLYSFMEEDNWKELTNALYMYV